MSRRPSPHARRRLLKAGTMLFAVLIAGCGTEAAPTPASEARTSASDAAASKGHVVVYRSATCECCGGHVAHLKDAGLAVREEIVDDVAEVKTRLGVPDDVQSCHTSEVAGYFVEGHVPADVITGLIEQRPDIDGIALPGMPTGAPGMPGEMPERLPVVSVTDGRSTVFAPS